MKCQFISWSVTIFQMSLSCGKSIYLYLWCLVPLQELLSKGWPWHNTLSFPVLAFHHSVASLQYLFSVSPLHWWTRSCIMSLNLIAVHFLKLILITYPSHLNVPRFIQSTMKQYTYSLWCCTHAKVHIHILIALCIPSWQPIWSSHVTDHHCVHSKLLCCIPCPCLWYIHQCKKDNTIHYTVQFPYLHSSHS